MIFQQTFTITSNGVQADNVTNIIPCSISSADGYNNYQPTPATGDEATRIKAKMNAVQRFHPLILQPNHPAIQAVLILFLQMRHPETLTLLMNLIQARIFPMNLTVRIMMLQMKKITVQTKKQISQITAKNR